MEAEDIPRVDERPAVDTSLQQVFGFFQQDRDVGQFASADGELRRRLPETDLRHQPRRRSGDRHGALAGDGRVAHRGEEDRQPAFLEVVGALPGDRLVQRLPDAAEGLFEFRRLGPEFLAVGTGEAVEQLLVELVAEAGDLSDELRQGRVRVVVRRPGPGNAGTHEDRPREHRGSFDQSLWIEPAVDPGRAPRRPIHEGVERPLANHEAAVEAAVVDLVRIPLAEEHIRPLGHGVEMIGRARVDRERVEPFGIEASLVEEVRFGAGQQFQRGPHDLGIDAGCDADAPEIKRDRRDFLVRVKVRLGPGFENRDRPVTDEVIQRKEAIRHDFKRERPGREFGQHRFATAGHKKGREERRVRLVGQQIAVVLAVPFGQFVEGDSDRVLGPRQILERGRARSFQIIGGVQQPLSHGLPRGRVVPGQQMFEHVGHQFAEARVGAAVGEVQIPKRLRRVEQAGQFWEVGIHPIFPPRRAAIPTLST